MSRELRRSAGLYAREASSTDAFTTACFDSRRVLLLNEGRLVALQRRRNDGLLAAHRRGGEGRVLQVVGVLLGPHVEELERHGSVTGPAHVGSAKVQPHGTGRLT